MTYEETVASILEIPRFTKKNTPSHTREFLELLGNPQEKFPVIHVAGSNGKGSVCAFLNSVLTESGLHTGLFTSPHLVEIRERFRLDGECCSREQFLEAERQVKSAAQKLLEGGKPHPTFFEYVFGIGLLVFARAGVDCAVLETGLGGRLDATNAVKKPLLTVITSISLEHTEILGDTIEKIAAEKAGIIKVGVPVIFDGNEPLAEPVIRAAAAKMGAPVEKIAKENINILLNDGKNIDFSLDSGYDVTSVKIPSPAAYQVQNGALALAASHRLKEHFHIPEEAVRRGFAKTVWPGRMEEALPEIYLDGAHNVSGIQAFLETAGRLAKEPPILVFGMVADKNYREAMRLLCRGMAWEQVIFTKVRNTPRALDPECLKRQFQEELTEHRRPEEISQKEAPDGGKIVKLLSIEKADEALKAARKAKKPGQLLFCTGSLYLIGELKGIMEGIMEGRIEGRRSVT